MRIPAHLGAVCVLAIGGCGGSAPDSARPERSPPRSASPQRVTCADISTSQAARRLAYRVVDTLVAPEHQSRRRTAGIVAESLRATCSQPSLPGVDDPREYRPVDPVLKAIQASFDEEELGG